MTFLGLLAIASMLLAGGCWKMQELYWEWGDGGTDTDSETMEDTDSQSDPWPIGIEMCDIDILFVFDTSQSMMDTVDALAQEGFGGFTNMLASYPQPGTIRVGMTNHLYGNHYVIDEGNEQLVNCSEFLTHGMNGPVNLTSCQDIPTQSCTFSSGEVWIEGPSDTLSSEFNCVGRLPCQEDTAHEEETLQAGLEALEDPFNAGFLRDPALLLIIFISDEEDASEISDEAIRQGLLNQKGGDEDSVYIVTMAGDPNEFCWSEFFGEADPTPQIIAFTDLFGDHGRHFNMCNTSMNTALGAIVTMLTQACQEVL